jgi:hypothetical protein
VNAKRFNPQVEVGRSDYGIARGDLVVLFALSACQSQPNSNASKTQSPIGNTIRNLSYTIENEPVLLVDGAASQSISPNSASTAKTQLHLYEIVDLNGDNKDDAVIILLQQSGGSGSFFYVSVALQLDDGFKTLDAVLLGDRIRPTTIALESPHFVVRYMDRKPGQSMSEEPTVPVRQTFIVDNEDQQIVFVLDFHDDNAVTVKTDCNTMRGEYVVENNRLNFDKMTSRVCTAKAP